jgi:pectin methylesterase-like acyl-CoA thioesterase
MKLVVPLLAWAIALGLRQDAVAGTVLADNFSTSTLNSSSPAAPTSGSAAYQLFSSKTWSPAPSIAANDLKFGIVATTGGHVEAQGLFSATPIALTNAADYLELTVTFLNSSGLFTQGGHVGFGLYNSGGTAPIAGGMNATATTSTTTNGGAQGWQGYVAQIAYTGGNHRIATRPAQTITTANNQDLVTDGSGSQSYVNDVQLAGIASTFSQPAGSQLTESLRFTLSATGTLQIDSRLYLGAGTNGTLLVSLSASASGANFLTNSFDALALGWRATANTAGATLMDVQSITVATSLPIGGPSDTVAGLYFQQQPTDGSVGIPLAPAVSVVATNASGTPVTNAPVAISLAAGTGSLNGTLSQVTGDSGLATFADLSLSAAGTKQLQAVSGTNTILSATFTITGAPPVVTAVSPANNATGLCVDTLLRIAFDKPVLLQKSGSIRIYDTLAPAIPVDSIDLGANVDNPPAGGSTWNTAINVQPRMIGGETFTNHPVIVSGTTATIFPHAGVLTANRTYYVLMDSGVFTDTQGNVFPGISATNIWRFTTKATGPASSTNLVVAADGTGDFCTVQGALDYIPSGNTTPRLINIRNGTYTEIVNVNNRHNLTFRGQSRSNAVIAYDNNSAMNGSTHYRMAFKVNANDIALDTLTITNSTPDGGSQAEALMVETDKKRLVAWNVNLCSYQDTILLNTSGTQCYFQDCLIQGDTDFIWGGGNAFFTNCEIKSLFGGYLTQSRTTATSNGMSFVKCRLTKNGSITATLGRSLSNPDGNVAFINCLIDSHITGWTDANLRYWEFGNSNLAATAAVTYNGTQLAPTSPELTNARSAILWLNGWSPALLPTIQSHPASQAVPAGQPAVFSVNATGIPGPSYQWRKNGANISNATNATYSISSALPADAATYSVVVSTPAGSVLSSNATLTVNIPQALAFPGAEGAGAATTGGRGGDVYYVTTLADTGAGSFRNGISGAPASGRTICFKVSGNIVLNSTMTINEPNITVAGQTAPGDGICFQNYSLNIAANNVIVRHLRTRLGTNALQEADAMWINSGTNIIVDHLSASWSVDETLSASTDISSLTVQNCLITESLNNSIHVKGAHGYGGIISSSFDTTYSYLRNLYAHNNSRNPRIGSDSQAGTLRLDFRNNVIYNYGGRAGYTGGATESCEVNYVGNYCLKGPSGTYDYILEGGALTTHVYQNGNYIDLNENGLVDGANTGWAMFSGTYTQTNSPFPVPAATTETAPAAYQRVVALAGAMPWRRDANDQRIARTVRQHYGSIVDFVGSPSQPTEYITNGSVVGVRGWPALVSDSAPTDTDNDGMPDYWELATGLNPGLASDRNNTNVLTGYTRLEEYLNWLADAHALCDRNGSVDVSLRAATGGATNLTYSVANASNGTVSLLADGYTARFAAAANTNGVAGFTFTATDPAAAASFGPVSYGVLITTTNAPVSNTPPVLAAISNRTVIAGNVLSFTCSVTDTDTPPQTFLFSLQNGPAGATLNTNTGSFSWRPTIAQGGTTNTMSITVSDNGSPVMSATQPFGIAVLRPAQPLVAPGSSGSLPPVLTVSGDSGPDYTVQASTNLIHWLCVFTTNPAVLPFSWTDPDAAAFGSRFYRVVLGP